MTNYRQHLENAQIADEDEETDDIRLLKLKGRAIECMLYQDYLDISPIEETILFLISSENILAVKPAIAFPLCL